VERYTTLAARVWGSILLEINYFLFLGEQRSFDEGGAQRPYGVFMSPKRRVRAAHGRAAKIH